MMDISTASNSELDRLAEEVDARQGARVLDRIYHYLGRFVSYPNEAAQVAHAAWIVHAHAMHLWDTTPRLAFLSPEKGSGKTRAMEVTEQLVPDPVLCVNATANYLFRKVASDDGAPTVLLDEADTIYGPKAKGDEDLRGWLNAGYRKGAVAGRCVIRGKSIETEELPAYCAVALAGIGNLPDTVMSRSIVIAMRRRHSGEKVEPFRRRIHGPQADPIKMAIEAWTASWPQKVERWPAMPEQIVDRDADTWESLVTIADLAGEDWPARVRDAAVTLVTASKEQIQSLSVQLLADLKEVFGDAEQLQTETIIERLIARAESPWTNLPKTHKPLDATALARMLKKYEVGPRQLWFGSKQLRGYTAAELRDPWLRYLPSIPENPVTSVTPVTRLHSVTSVTGMTRPGGMKGESCHHCGGQGDLVDVFHGDVSVQLHRPCIDDWTAGQT